MRLDNLTQSPIQSPLPKGTSLVGYGALIAGLKLEVPPPDPIAVVSSEKTRSDPGKNHASRGGFAIYERNYQVEQDLGSHLIFALRHEKIDLLILKQAFQTAGPAEMAAFVKEAPTSADRRRAWFLFEWLVGTKLDIPDADAGNYVDALDAQVWHTAASTNSPRHRVRDNLPGVRAFCPLVRRAAGSEDAPLSETAERRVREATGELGDDLLRRLKRRLLFKDSKTTFLIEGEKPPTPALQKWSEIVAAASKRPLDLNYLIKLQSSLIDDWRFVNPGLRTEGVFLGEHVENAPLANWIGAKPGDLADLVGGIIDADRRMAERNVDPIAHATAVGFGWVFVHPFQDGNGRIHRYLFQHVFAERGVLPLGISLPISTAIWSSPETIQEYYDVLRGYDVHRLPFIKWRPTEKGNVEVTNDTVDLYRYYDATDQALFLSRRVDDTLARDIPNELIEMKRRDQALDAIRAVVEMPDMQIDRFIGYVVQNNGSLSKSKKKSEFSALKDEEILAMEEAVREAFELAQAHPRP
jgi:hypothetical protein